MTEIRLNGKPVAEGDFPIVNIFNAENIDPKVVFVRPDGNEIVIEMKPAIQAGQIDTNKLASQRLFSDFWGYTFILIVLAAVSVGAMLYVLTNPHIH